MRSKTARVPEFNELILLLREPNGFILIHSTVTTFGFPTLFNPLHKRLCDDHMLVFSWADLWIWAANPAANLARELTASRELSVDGRGPGAQTWRSLYALIKLAS